MNVGSIVKIKTRQQLEEQQFKLQHELFLSNNKQGSQIFLSMCGQQVVIIDIIEEQRYKQYPQYQYYNYLCGVVGDHVCSGPIGDIHIAEIVSEGNGSSFRDLCSRFSE
jgi:hypothetical protein